jgi:cytochrome oxidase Cu insertion factor (SCO1/SenC/PrrC family)
VLASFTRAREFLSPAGWLDPRCVDICPLVSQEYIDAYRGLGRDASRAVFVAINVNP